MISPFDKVEDVHFRSGDETPVGFLTNGKDKVRVLLISGNWVAYETGEVLAEGGTVWEYWREAK